MQNSLTNKNFARCGFSIWSSTELCLWPGSCHLRHLYSRFRRLSRSRLCIQSSFTKKQSFLLSFLTIFKLAFVFWTWNGKESLVFLEVRAAAQPPVYLISVDVPCSCATWKNRSQKVLLNASIIPTRPLNFWDSRDLKQCWTAIRRSYLNFSHFWNEQFCKCFLRKSVTFSSYKFFIFHWQMARH